MLSVHCLCEYLLGSQSSPPCADTYLQDPSEGGELESIRDGRSILIPRDAIDKWIEMKRRQGRGRR